MTVKKSIQELNKSFLIENIERPISIEIGREAFRRLNEEMKMVVKYSEKNNLRHNEMFYDGILIIAPKNCRFG